MAIITPVVATLAVGVAIATLVATATQELKGEINLSLST